MQFMLLSPSGRVATGLRRGAAGTATFVALAVVAVAVAGLDPSALWALPALVLPALLVFRRYPGERTLAVRLREARRERRPRTRPAPALARSPRIAVPRGGLLLACSLAVRPPPQARLAAG